MLEQAVRNITHNSVRRYRPTRADLADTLCDREEDRVPSLRPQYPHRLHYCWYRCIGTDIRQRPRHARGRIWVTRLDAGRLLHMFEPHAVHLCSLQATERLKTVCIGLKSHAVVCSAQACTAVQTLSPCGMLEISNAIGAMAAHRVAIGGWICSMLLPCTSKSGMYIKLV